jgi:environmental stress-induced protein Ves
MTVQTISVDAVRPQPWRNGGGITRELLTWPSAQAWGLRISVADIERDGPFSAFAGVDRWFGVLQGAGVRLAFDDGEMHEVRPGEAPIRFDGGRPLQCVLLDGPTRDLNVMVARKRGHASCEPAQPGASRNLRADLVAVFAQDATCLVHERGRTDLSPMTLAWTAAARHPQWRIESAARAWWITFSFGQGGA